MLTIPEGINSENYKIFDGCDENLIININCTNVNNKQDIYIQLKKEYSDTVNVIHGAEEIIAGKEATFTTKGKTEGKCCSECEEVLIPQEEIDTSESNISAEGSSVTAKLNIIGVDEDNNNIYELIISGIGEMKDFSAEDVQPWDIVRNNINKITIQKNVTNIGENAFNGCGSVTEIIIPETVTSIGKAAIAWCTSLTEIAIPESVTHIKEGTFASCFNLTEIILSKNITTIGNGAFLSCYELTRIIIPENITSIEDEAFANSGLIEVTIPGSVQELGWEVFANCTSLENVIIEKGLDKISFGTFTGCKDLTEIIIPDSVTKIETFAFQNCFALEEITIPEGVTDISGMAF